MDFDDPETTKKLKSFLREHLRVTIEEDFRYSGEDERKILVSLYFEGDANTPFSSECLYLPDP